MIRPRASTGRSSSSSLTSRGSIATPRRSDRPSSGTRSKPLPRTTGKPRWLPSERPFGRMLSGASLPPVSRSTRARAASSSVPSGPVTRWCWMCCPMSMPGDTSSCRRTSGPANAARSLSQHGLEGLPASVINEDTNGAAFRPSRAFAARLAERGLIVFAPHNPYRGGDHFPCSSARPIPWANPFFRSSSPAQSNPRVAGRLALRGLSPHRFLWHLLRRKDRDARPGGSRWLCAFHLLRRL